MAPIPIPAAISKETPPSIGQAGSNGSPQGSGGGSAIVLTGLIKAKSKDIDMNNSIFLVFVISFYSAMGYKNNGII